MGRQDLASLTRDYRTVQGITQAELADKIGLTPSGVSRIESGQRGIRRSTLDAIGGVFCLPDVAQANLMLAGGYAPPGLLREFEEHEIALCGDHRSLHTLRWALNSDLLTVREKKQLEARVVYQIGRTVFRMRGLKDMTN